MDDTRTIFGIDSSYMHIGPKLNVQQAQIRKKEERYSNGKKKKKQKKQNGQEDQFHDTHVIDIRC